MEESSRDDKGRDQPWLKFLSSAIQSKSLAVFCGAGASFNSGIPLAYELKREILTRLSLPEDEVKKQLSLDLPFELFMSCVNYGLPAKGLTDIFLKGAPNQNHFLIAKLAKHGHVKTIFTSNFDLLLEKALELEGLTQNKDFFVHKSETDFLGLDFDAPGIQVVKLHGCASSVSDIGITLESVSRRNYLDGHKKVIEYLFSTGSHLYVLIIGYSCSDLFDISPQIVRLSNSPKSVLFIEHMPQNIVQGEEFYFEDIRKKSNKNPFNQFKNGVRLYCNTDVVVQYLWGIAFNSRLPSSCGRVETDWESVVKAWIARSKVLYKSKNVFTIVGQIYWAISDFEAALLWHNKAYELVVDVSERSVFSVNVGQLYYELRKFDKAESEHLYGLKLAVEIGEPSLEGSHKMNLANIYLNTGRIQLAEKYFTEAISILKTNNDYKRLHVATSNLGLLYLDSGRFSKGFKFFQIAYETSKVLGEKEAEANHLGHIGTYYAFMEKPELAFDYHKRSLDIFEELSNRKGVAIRLAHLGGDCRAMGDLQQSLNYLNESIRVCLEVGNTDILAQSYGGIALTYRFMNLVPQSLEYYGKAQLLFQQSGNVAEECITIGNIAGLIQENDTETGIDLYLKALSMSKTLGDPRIEGDQQKDFSLLMLRTGHLVDSFIYSLKSHKRFLLIYEAGHPKRKLPWLNYLLILLLGPIFLIRRLLKGLI